MEITPEMYPSLTKKSLVQDQPDKVQVVDNVLQISIKGIFTEDQ